MASEYWLSLYPIVAAWFPAISTSAILGFAVFLTRSAFKSEIERSIAHRYDAKLELLKSEQRQSEEALKSEIKRRDDQIQALRSGTLSSLTARQTLLAQRRLSAIDALWSSVVEQNKLKSITNYVPTLNLPVIAQEIKSGGVDGASVQQFMDMIWKSSGLDGYKLADDAAKDRPFVPANIWSLYAVRFSILAMSFGMFNLARLGLDAKGALESGKLISDAKSALPHRSQYIDAYGLSALTMLVEEIEQLMLKEIGLDLTGHEADANGLMQAHAIIQRADELIAHQFPAPTMSKGLEKFAAEPPPDPPNTARPQ